MNNFAIAKILRHMHSTRNVFLKVYPADQIPSRNEITTYPCCFVANTDPSWMPGTHWVAVFIGRNGRVEYFDSYGRRPMSPKMKAFCGTDYIYNPKVVQSIFSALCGHFCIYFLAQRCSGKSVKNIIKQFDENNALYNENLVLTFVHSRFPHHKLSCGGKSVHQKCKAKACRRANNLVRIV